MTHDIYKFLGELGFREDVVRSRENAKSFCIDAFGARECECEKKTPDFWVHVYPETLQKQKRTYGGQVVPETIEVGICAMVSDIWFTASPYGMSFEYFKENYIAIRAATVASWNYFFITVKRCRVEQGQDRK